MENIYIFSFRDAFIQSDLRIRIKEALKITISGMLTRTLTEMQMKIPASGFANWKKVLRLASVGVTEECPYDNHVLGGRTIPPLLHCVFSSLSFTLKTAFFPSLLVSCPPLHPLMPPVDPSPRSILTGSSVAAFLECLSIQTTLSALMDGPSY